MATKRYQLAGIMGNKVYVGSGDMPEGFNVQIDPEGDCLEAVGAIITVPVNKWIANDDGTYTNTIDVEGVSDTTVYDISLYGDATDEQATAFSESITSVATTTGQIVITASESVTVELQLLLSGKINLADQEVVYVKDLKASRMSYDNTSSGLAATDVQGAVDEVDSKLDSFIIKTFTSDTVTIAALGSTTVTFENIMADGYRFVFAVPGWTNGTNHFLAIGCVPFPQGNKVELSIRNFYNSGEATGSYTIVALFIKE